MNKSGIYKIVNLVNNKIYVGSSINLNKREKDHFKDLNGNYHRNRYLQNAWNKYGLDNFKFEVLEHVKDESKLLEKEQYYLDIYFDNQKCCYNICPTAGSSFGVKFSDEIKLKSSIVRGGKPFYAFKIKDRELIGEWINQGECGRYLNINSKDINNCLKNKRDTTHGYIFIYKDEYSEQKLNEIYNKINPFLVFDKYTGDFISKHDTIMECIIDLKLNRGSHGNIGLCLRNKQYSVSDYVFIYEDEYTDEKLKELCDLYNKTFYVYRKNNGEFIGEFESQLSCVEELNINKGHISNCLNGNRRSTDGFIFIYVKDFSEEKLNEIRNKSLCSFQFEVYNKNTNELIGIYDNQLECARELEINHACVNNCLNGKSKYAKDYIFKKIA